MSTAVVVSVHGRGEPGGLSLTVAAEIRARLGRAGITQAELAKRMGRDQVWMSRRLNPKVGPRTVPISLPEVEEFAEALGIPWWQLLPRLDSNQQPFGFRRRLSAVPSPRPTPRIELPRRAGPSLTLAS